MTIEQQQWDWLEILRMFNPPDPATDGVKPLYVQHNKSNPWHEECDDSCSQKRIWTRTILPNELLVESDDKDWTAMKTKTEAYLKAATEAGYQVQVYYSGGKSIHCSLFIKPDQLDRIEWKEGEDPWLVIRQVVYRSLCEEAGLPTGTFDLTCINWSSKHKGHPVREVGCVRSKGFTKTLIEAIPETRPAEPLPLVFPDNVPLNTLPDNIITKVNARLIEKRNFITSRPTTPPNVTGLFDCVKEAIKRGGKSGVREPTMLHILINGKMAGMERDTVAALLHDFLDRTEDAEERRPDVERLLKGHYDEDSGMKFSHERLNALWGDTLCGPFCPQNIDATLAPDRKRATETMRKARRRIKVTYDENGERHVEFDIDAFAFEDIIDLLSTLVPKGEINRTEAKTFLILSQQFNMLAALLNDHVVYIQLVGPPSSFKTAFMEMIVTTGGGIRYDATTPAGAYGVYETTPHVLVGYDELDQLIKRYPELGNILRTGNRLDARRTLRVPDGDGGFTTSIQEYGGPKVFTCYEQQDKALGTRCYSKTFKREFDSVALQGIISGNPELLVIRDWLRAFSAKALTNWSRQKVYDYTRTAEFLTFIKDVESKLRVVSENDIIPRIIATACYIHIFGLILGIDTADCVEDFIEKANDEEQESTDLSIIKDFLVKVMDEYRALVRTHPVGNGYELVTEEQPVGRGEPFKVKPYIEVNRNQFVKAVNKHLTSFGGFYAMIKREDLHAKLTEAGFVKGRTWYKAKRKGSLLLNQWVLRFEL